MGDMMWAGANNTGQYALSCLVKGDSIEGNETAWAAGTGLLAGSLGKAGEEALGTLAGSTKFARYSVGQHLLRGAARTVAPAMGDASAQRIVHSLRTSTGTAPLTVSPPSFSDSPGSLGSGSGASRSQMGQSPYVFPWLQ